jgi:putative transposase
MREKFKGKYRIDTLRLQNWDYGWNGSYFITFCTKNRVHFFGEIKAQSMQLSQLGKIAHQLFLEIPERFPYVTVNALVVMPDHVHCVITIHKKTNEHLQVEIPDGGGGATKNKNPMFHENISRIIRWYKGRTTFECRKINPIFEWQSRFYDHIIRNRFSYYNIIRYIHQNPENWVEEK